MKELREAVLETLAQIDGGQEVMQTPQSVQIAQDRDILSASLIDEREFLSLQRQKLLVLFEGLLSPNVQSIEQKLELVLKYLQYQLAEIDKRLQEI